MKVHRQLGTALVFAAFGSALPADGAGLPPDPVLTSVPPTGAYARRNRFLEWHPVARGRSLPPDSELHCPGGCSVRTSDGSTLTLDPSTHIGIGYSTFVPMGGTMAALGMRFELLEGSVTAAVVTDPKRPRTIVVATPNDGTIAVKPGEAQVVVNGGRSGVACLQGGARVKRGHASLDLRAGEAASLGDGDAPLAARPMGAAPSWKGPSGKLDEPQPLAVVFGDGLDSPALS